MLKQKQWLGDKPKQHVKAKQANLKLNNPSKPEKQQRLVFEA